MVCIIRFISLLLGLLLLLNALRDYSCAHAHHQGWEKDKNKHVMSEDVVSSHCKELTSTRKLGLGGRKMVADHQVLMRRKYEKEQSTFSEGASEDISGEKNHALLKSLQVSEPKYMNFNHQKDMNSLKLKTQKSGSWGSPRSEPELVHLQDTKTRYSHQDSKKLPTKASLESLSRSDNKQPQAAVPKPKAETQRLLEATKEIVNLMNKDYRGMPRRKPPINNHVPVH